MIIGLPAELRARVHRRLNVRDRAALYWALPRACRAGLTPPAEERCLGELFQAARRGHLVHASTCVRHFLRTVPDSDPTWDDLRALLVNPPAVGVSTEVARLTDADVRRLSEEDVVYLLCRPGATPDDFDRLATLLFSKGFFLGAVRDNCLRDCPAMFDHGVAVGRFDLASLRPYLTYFPKETPTWLPHYPDLTRGELVQFRAAALGNLCFDAARAIQRRLDALPTV